MHILSKFSRIIKGDLDVRGRLHNGDGTLKLASGMRWGGLCTAEENLVLTEDYTLIRCDATGNHINLTLPEATVDNLGIIYSIIRITGTPGNQVRIATSGGDLIDGGAGPFVLNNNRESVMLTNCGVPGSYQWVIMAAYN